MNETKTWRQIGAALTPTLSGLHRVWCPETGEEGVASLRWENTRAHFYGPVYRGYDDKTVLDENPRY